MRPKYVYDWTGLFDIEPNNYKEVYHEDKIELIIPVPGLTKSDLKITRNTRGKKNFLDIDIPFTELSDSRTMGFNVSETYSLKGTKANVREGILYIYIPKIKESKPEEIPIS